MRKTRSQILLLTTTLVIVVTLTALVSMRGQVQKTPARPDHAQQKSDFASRFPIADYDAAESADVKEPGKRKSKDNRFPKGRLDESHGVTETTIVDGNASERLPALPVTVSDIVIIGNVLNGRAYLSSSKTGLFSEFTINIEEVLKTTESNPVLVGSNISVEREGGGIRYPSGHIRWIRFAGEGMPSISGRYLFFLRRTSQENTYIILTGYELRERKVFPLDGVADFDGDKLPKFAMYEGVEESDFLKTVRELIN